MVTQVFTFLCIAGEQIMVITDAGSIAITVAQAQKLTTENGLKITSECIKRKHIFRRKMDI